MKFYEYVKNNIKNLDDKYNSINANLLKANKILILHSNTFDGNKTLYFLDMYLDNFIKSIFRISKYTVYENAEEFNNLHGNTTISDYDLIFLLDCEYSKDFKDKEILDKSIIIKGLTTEVNHDYKEIIINSELSTTGIMYSLFRIYYNKAINYNCFINYYLRYLRNLNIGFIDFLADIYNHYIIFNDITGLSKKYNIDKSLLSKCNDSLNNKELLTSLLCKYSTIKYYTYYGFLNELIIN